MALSLIASVLMLSAQTTPLVCPVMGDRVGPKSTAYEYNGAKFAVCCAGCTSKLFKQPLEVLTKANENKWVTGEFLFDPVTRTLLRTKKVKTFSDFGGIRFYFDSEENKTTFDKSPKTYGTLPKKEVPLDVMTRQEIVVYSRMAGYFDLDGIRFYHSKGSDKELSTEDIQARAADYAKMAAAPVVRMIPKSAGASATDISKGSP
jgi:YHS domain-containing protein